jgi:hypothetical protein
MATIPAVVGWNPRPGIRAIAFAAAVVAFAAAPAAMADAISPSRVGAGVIDRLDAGAANVRAYWTPARMRAAEPAGFLAPPTARAASKPRHPEQATRTAKPSAKRAQLATRVGHIKRQPTRTHGKVFFSAGAYDYQCSGTAVKAPSRSLVFTAGHCAYGTGLLGGANQVHRWEFVPAYDGGRKPFGEWPAVRLAAPAGWVTAGPIFDPITGEVDGGDSRYDVGAAIVARRHGRTLGSAVGASKAGFGRPRDQRYEAFGYPAESPFNGRREFACGSPYEGSDSTYADPAPIRISCDMTAGASGGGWIDGKGRLVSVTSYAYTDDSASLYGPFFGAAIRAFYDSVRNG